MRYFAYGSNMNPDRMREREINFSKREPAILKGWKLEFNKIASPDSNEGYANMVMDEKSIVEGILYEIQEEDIKKLDRYEGYPNHYQKLNIRVKTDNEEEVEAVTYAANSDKVRDGLKPRKKYLEHLLKGCNLLSEEYCKKLRRWKTLD